jgi:hypothetical protein
MRVDRAREILEASLLAGEDQLASEIRFGCASDLMSDVLALSLPDSLLLTGLTTVQVIYTAEMAGLKAVCFVRARTPPAEAVALAQARGIVVMCSSLPMFDCCGRLHAAGLGGCPTTGGRNSGAAKPTT